MRFQWIQCELTFDWIQHMTKLISNNDAEIIRRIINYYMKDALQWTHCVNHPWNGFLL